MKNTLIIVALCSLFSCGADTSYSGRIHEAIVAGEASARTSRSGDVRFDAVENTIHIDDASFAVELDGSGYNFAQQGDVIAGLGTVSPTTLNFTVSLVRRRWPYGFTTIQFDGVPSVTASEEEPQTFVPMSQQRQ
ncbi:MAG: hypothetical protein ACO1OB_07155 [Archangium sp.]